MAEDVTSGPEAAATMVALRSAEGASWRDAMAVLRPLRGRIGLAVMGIGVELLRSFYPGDKWQPAMERDK